MELRDLIQALSRFRVLALLVFAACVGLGAAAAFLPAPVYRATSTVLVQPAPDSDGRIDLPEIEAVRFLVPSVPEVVDTRTFEAGVRGALPPAQREANFSIFAEDEPGTSIIRLSVESTDQEIVEPVVNAATRRLVARRLIEVVDFLVVDPGRRPDAPARPRRVAILAGSTVVGLIAAVFAALGAAAVRRRLTGPEEFRERFGLEVLGEIPRVRHFPASPRELFRRDAEPTLVEAYNRLATSLVIGLASRPTAAVAVTSCAVGEGKSTVTANLAQALATLGHAVVAVDCDLRRPGLARQFELENGRGISDVGARDDIESLQRTTHLSTLTVITSGQSERHPTEVVSTVFPRLLSAFQSPDRLVLVDSPPLVVAEATLVAVMTRTAVLVVDAGKRDPQEIERAVAELRQAGVTLLGVVVNRVKRTRHREAVHYYYAQPSPRRG